MGRFPQAPALPPCLDDLEAEIHLALLVGELVSFGERKGQQGGIPPFFRVWISLWIGGMPHFFNSASNAPRSGRGIGVAMFSCSVMLGQMSPGTSVTPLLGQCFTTPNHSVLLDFWVGHHLLAHLPLPLGKQVFICYHNKDVAVNCVTPNSCETGKEVNMGNRRSEITDPREPRSVSPEASYDDEVAEIAALNRDY